MRTPITVHKLDETGREVWRYHGIVLDRTNTSLTLEAHFDREDVDFHGMLLQHGDRSVETYYSDRWYNVFAIYDVDDDHHKGWYCNITRPARIEAKHMYAEDLALDLIITSDGEQIVVDEEEFAMLEISPEERQQALKTLGHLQAMAAIRDGPFNGGEHVYIDTGPSRVPPPSLTAI